MKKKKHLMEGMLHFLIGFVLVVKGFDKFDHNHFMGGLIVAFGVIVLLYCLYDILTKRQSKTLKLLAHLFEGIAILYTSYIFFKDSKTYLAYLFLVASVGFFISIVVIFIKARQKNGKPMEGKKEG